MQLRRLAVSAVLMVCIPGLSGVVHAQTEAATRQYAAASGFQNQKLFDSAIEEWKTFIQKYPNDPRIPLANHYLGICCIQEEQFSDAIRALNNVVNKHPNFEHMDQSSLNLGIAWYGYAQKTKKKQDFGNADAVLTRMLSKFPNSEFAATAMYYRGESLLEQGQTAQAAGAYASLLQKFPNNKNAADATYALGTVLEDLKKAKEAQTVYASFMLKYPSHELLTEVRMRQGQLLFDDGDYQKAQPLFSAVSKDRKFELADVAMLRHARCLYEQGQMTEAAKQYWEVPRVFRGTKHYDAAILAGAKCYFLDGNYRTARSGLENVAKRNKPEAAEATQWLARSWLKEDDAATALAIAERGLLRFRGRNYRPELEMVRLDALYELPARKPEAAKLYADFAKRNASHELAPQAQYMAALSALELEDHASARQYAEQFLKQFRSHELAADVLFVSAESQLLLGKHTDAVQQYREFLRADPQHDNAQQAQVRMGLAMHLAKDHDAAIDWLNQIQARLTDKSLRSEAFSLIGRSYIETDRIEDAGRMLQQSVTADPDRKGNDETYLALADAYRRQGRHREATQQLQSVLRRYPNSSLLDEVHFRLGETAYGDEEFEEAIRRYQLVVRQYPKSDYAPHAQYGLGWTYFNLERYRDATDAMTTLLRRYPGAKIAAKGYYVRAMASYELAEYTDVLRDVTDFLETQPDKTATLDARYVQGLAYAGLKRFDQAARTYEGILATARDYEAADKVAYELAWAWTELGQNDKAATAFRRLARDFPASPLAGESLFRIGENYYEAEEYADAATAYRDSAAKATTAEISEKSLHKLGWSHLKSDNTRAASQAFQNQLREHPSGELAGDARFLIAECGFREKDWQTALTAYERVVRSGDSNYVALAMFRAGECAGSLKKWSSSRDWHQKVLADHPDFDLRPEARYGLAWALQNEQKYDQAVRLYEKVTEETQTETAAKARFMIGECCFAQKKHEEAARHFLKTAFSYNHKQWSPLAWFEAGRCYEALRKSDRAKNCYEQLIAKYPKHEKVSAARSRLRALGG